MASSLQIVIASNQSVLRLWLGCIVAFLSVIVRGNVSYADEPLQIDSVSLHGLTVNAATTIEVRGKGFDETLQLDLPVAVQQKLKLHSPGHAEIEVQLGNVAPQLVWGAFRSGSQVTGSRRWAIDTLPNKLFGEQTTSIPVALSGALSGNQVQRTEIQLSEGDYFYVDVQARRLGANFQPLVRVLDDKNRQMASSGPVLSSDGDAICTFRVPKSGKYFVTLQDLTFAAPTGPFRMRMARTSDEKLLKSRSLDLEVNKPQDASLFSYWALPDYRSTSPIDFGLQGVASVSESSLSRSLRSQWELHDAASLRVEEVPNLGKVVRVPRLPAIVRGAVGHGESARFIVTCGAGKPLDAEVWASRLGSNFDPRLMISTIDKRPLGTGDDRPGTIDPRVRFSGEANVNEVVVTVDSVIPIQGQREAFELVLVQAAAEPIGLELLTPQLVIRPGSMGLLEVKVIRNGMNQPIELRAVALEDEANPSAVQTVVSIPENQERALVPVQLGEHAMAGQWFSVIAKYPNAELARIVQATVPGRDITATGVAEHTIPVIGDSSAMDAKVSWKEGSVEAFDFVAGMSYEIPVNWSWPVLTDEQKGWMLKAELVTTQNVPRTNPQDGNSPIDYRKTLHIGTLSPETKNAVVVPVGDPNAPTSASFAQVRVGEEGALRIVIPADTNEDRFQWSVRWSLLNAEGKLQGSPWLMKPLLGRIISPLTLKLEKELATPWNWSKDDSQNVVNVLIETRSGVTGKAQVLWQGFPQGINTSPMEIELMGEAKLVSVKLPDLSQQAPGTKLEGIKLVVQWKPNFEGYSAPYNSPAVALPALNFP